jgi:hypothetical protein
MTDREVGKKSSIEQYSSEPGVLKVKTISIILKFHVPFSSVSRFFQFAWWVMILP